MNFKCFRPLGLVQTGLLALFFVASTQSHSQSPAQSIVMASTTSTEQSGLFAHLLPAFKKASGLDVKVVALGTGQSIHAGELPQNGDHRFTRIEPLPPKEIPQIGAEFALFESQYGIER